MSKRARRRLRGRAREQNNSDFCVVFGGVRYYISLQLLVTDQQYSDLTSKQVRVGYKTELSHQERQHWLKNRTYSTTKLRVIGSL